jgi:hypothetical protein
MAVHIPPILVVIACKVVMAGNPDPNASFTHVENTVWATENSMMVCQRHEVDLYDPVEGMQLNPSDQPVPALNPNFADHGQCARAGIALAVDWDQAHRNTPWRVWRIGCPSPIVDLRSGALAVTRTRWCARPTRRFSVRYFSISTARKSLTLVSVGPVTKRSPIALKKVQGSLAASIALALMPAFSARASVSG